MNLNTIKIKGTVKKLSPKGNIKLNPLFVNNEENSKNIEENKRINDLRNMR